MNVAVLWDSAIGPDDREISSRHIRQAYELLSDASDFTVHMANYEWLESSHLSKSFTCRSGCWTAAESTPVDLIFDKTGVGDERAGFKRRINKDFDVVNPLRVEKVCSDKLLTAETFPELMPGTEPFSQEAAERFVEQDGKAVIKPRSDFGGRGVKVVSSVEDIPEEGDLVQRFKDFSSGIPGIVDGVHDLRILVMGGEKLCAFVRTPSEGVVSNVNRGGTLQKVDLSKVPEPAIRIAENVDSELRDYGKRFYSVDIGFSEGSPYLLELNSKPALVFYGDEQIKSWKEPVIRRLARYLGGFSS